jgi:Na+-translocating membrane potential-generating system MpsC-like protein
MAQEQTIEPQSGANNTFESIRAEISREMVRLYKELFGRGPTKARTEFFYLEQKESPEREG